MIVKS